MRRVAMLLGMVGVIGLGLATTPAQAQDGRWGHPNRQEQAWREHQAHEWAWRHHAWREPHHWHPYQYGYNFR